MVVVINGVKYVYEAGSTVTVPDEVALLISESEDLKPVPAGDKSQDEKIADLQERLNELALDLEAVSAELESQDGRLDEIDTPETGALALLDARVTVLEEAANTGD